MASKSMWKKTLAKSELRAVVYLIIILSAAFIARCFHLMQDGLWTDEMISMYTSNPEVSLRRTYDVLHFWDQTPPLYPVLLWLWMKVFGFTDFSARFFSVLGGMLCLIASYFFASDFLSKRAALSATFVAALTPYQIYFSREARSYIWGLLAATCFVHALFRRFRGDESLRLRVWFVLSGAAFLYVSYFAFFIHAAAFLVLICLVLSRRISFSALRRWLVDWLLMGLLYLPWLPPFLRIFSFHNGPTSQPNPSYVIDLLSVFSSTISAGWFLGLLYLIVLLWGIARVMRLRQFDSGVRVFLLASSLFFASFLLMYVKSVAGRNVLAGFAFSYVIVLYPLFLISIATLFDQLRKPYLLGFLLAFVSFNILHFQSWRQLAWGKQKNEPYRELAQLIARSSQPNISIIASTTYIQEFYFSRLGLSSQLINSGDISREFAGKCPSRVWVIDSYALKSAEILKKLLQYCPIEKEAVYRIESPDKKSYLKAILVSSGEN